MPGARCFLCSGPGPLAGFNVSWYTDLARRSGIYLALLALGPAGETVMLRDEVKPHRADRPSRIPHWKRSSVQRTCAYRSTCHLLAEMSCDMISSRQGEATTDKLVIAKHCLCLSPCWLSLSVCRQWMAEGVSVSHWRPQDGTRFGRASRQTERR
jgi:hypothetical protein